MEQGLPTAAPPPPEDPTKVLCWVQGSERGSIVACHVSMVLASLKAAGREHDGVLVVHGKYVELDLRAAVHCLPYSHPDFVLSSSSASH